MATAMHLPLLSSFLLLAAIARADDPITTATGLIAAIRDGAEGASLAIGEGTFELEGPLKPKAGMTIKGAGVGKTIITHAAAWKPSTETLPDPEMRTQGMNTRAYLFRLGDDADGITISHMTLRGPQLHGAIFGWNNGGYGNRPQHSPRHRLAAKACRRRNEESAAARIENNVLTNITDAALNQMPQAGTTAGPEAPLRFACGVDGEMTVSGWEIQATPRP